jgi:hypothetical protein
MLHISNLFHLATIVFAWLVIVFFTKDVSRTKFATVLRLLQIIPLMFCIDLVAGFVVIDTVYGSHQSASWISRSAMVFPLLFALAIWRMFRLRRTQ